MKDSIAQLSVNTIKNLAIDAVEKAQSGHPGMPMGCADLGYVLWTDFLNVTPSDPKWPNRDRFILSAGHGSMFLYSLLHLAGFKVSLKDIESFRQLGSKTPGHPEYGHTEGVECTTGPLGQGTGNAVGMAIAAQMMAAQFNSKEFSLIDHHVIALVSDGDLMEGISSEACSMAGHLRVPNLIFIYDDNKITIDGSTTLAFSEDVGARYKAYGWNVFTIDGHDHDQIRNALDQAKKESKSGPVLIIAKTTIAQGAPTKQGKSASHGAPLGQEEVAQTKKAMAWSYPPFTVPEEVRLHFQQKMSRAEEKKQEWEKQFSAWRGQNPEKAKQWDQMWARQVPQDLFEVLMGQLPKMPNATRVVSNEIQQQVASLVPSLVGGSADLASSCKTLIKGSKDVVAGSFEGRNLHFGIREHAMGSIQNGLALYGSWIPYSSTFLVFSDYMRSSIRLAALSQLPSIFIFTHDSIHVGEDGPTHQPIEHIPSLRLIPNLNVYRPCDSLETAAMWAQALGQKVKPSAFILSRQNLDVIEREPTFDPKVILRGGYILQEAAGGSPDWVVMATGSEVGLACQVKRQLEKSGQRVRVVSMPCLEVFSQQDKSYQASVLPSGVRRCVIETSTSDLWYKWLGQHDVAIGMNEFGASGPAKDVASHFGFTVDQIVKQLS